MKFYTLIDFVIMRSAGAFSRVLLLIYYWKHFDYPWKELKENVIRHQRIILWWLILVTVLGILRTIIVINLLANKIFDYTLPIYIISAIFQRITIRIPIHIGLATQYVIFLKYQFKLSKLKWSTDFMAMQQIYKQYKKLHKQYKQEHHYTLNWAIQWFLFRMLCVCWIELYEMFEGTLTLNLTNLISLIGITSSVPVFCFYADILNRKFEQFKKHIEAFTPPNGDENVYHTKLLQQLYQYPIDMKMTFAITWKNTVKFVIVYGLTQLIAWEISALVNI